MNPKNMINTLIIEVSKQSVRLISSTIKSTFPNFKVVGVSDSISNGLVKIESLNPDLIFLNFDLTGFKDHDYLDMISNYQIPIIFISMYSQHAHYAIKYSPIDYLVYPFSLLDLNKALEKVEKLNQLST